MLGRTEGLCEPTCVQGCVKGEWVSVSWVLGVAVCEVRVPGAHVSLALLSPSPSDVCAGRGFWGGGRSLLQQRLAQLACMAIFPGKPETAKLPLPQIPLGLREGSRPSPRKEGERLKGRSFCPTRERGCLLHPCQVPQPRPAPPRALYSWV